jgi:MFS family permease
MIGTIFILVFAQSIEMLMAGGILCGIPWGVFQTLTTSYAAEICPMAIRGHLTSFVNICWASGLFIAACVVRGTISIENEWGWRLPYMLQWVWPVPLFLICLFAPESEFPKHKSRPRLTCRSMVVVPSWSTGRSQELDPTDRSQGLLYRTTLKRPSRTHRPHARVRMARDQERKSIQLFQGYQSTSTRNRLCGLVGPVLVWSTYDWLFNLLVCSPNSEVVFDLTLSLQNAGLSVSAAFSMNLGNYGMLIFGTLVVWGCRSFLTLYIPHSGGSKRLTGSHQSSRTTPNLLDRPGPHRYPTRNHRYPRLFTPKRQYFIRYRSFDDAHQSYFRNHPWPSLLYYRG